MSVLCLIICWMICSRLADSFITLTLRLHILVWYFHRCCSFYWFVQDVRAACKLPNVNIGSSVMVFWVFDVFCLALPSAVQLVSSVLGHCTPLWFRSGASDFSPDASSISIRVSSSLVSNLRLIVSGFLIPLFVFRNLVSKAGPYVKCVSWHWELGVRRSCDDDLSDRGSTGSPPIGVPLQLSGSGFLVKGIYVDSFVFLTVTVEFSVQFRTEDVRALILPVSFLMVKMPYKNIPVVQTITRPTSPLFSVLFPSLRTPASRSWLGLCAVGRLPTCARAWACSGGPS